MRLMDTIAIQKAVEIVGGQTALARKIGRSQGLIWMWCSGRLPVPAKYCRPIEDLIATTVAEQVKAGRVTACEVPRLSVTRYDLRPDVFGESAAVPLQEAG